MTADINATSWREKNWTLSSDAIDIWPSLLWWNILHLTLIYFVFCVGILAAWWLLDADVMTRNPLSCCARDCESTYRIADRAYLRYHLTLLVASSLIPWSDLSPLFLLLHYLLLVCSHPSSGEQFSPEFCLLNDLCHYQDLFAPLLMDRKLGFLTGRGPVFLRAAQSLAVRATRVGTKHAFAVANAVHRQLWFLRSNL